MLSLCSVGAHHCYRLNFGSDDGDRDTLLQFFDTLKSAIDEQRLLPVYPPMVDSSADAANYALPTSSSDSANNNNNAAVAPFQPRPLVGERLCCVLRASVFWCDQLSQQSESFCLFGWPR